MGDKKFSLHAAVYIILEKEHKILLLRRYNTGWEDGQYTLPAGHLDGGETVSDTAIREAKEEIGIILNNKDIEIVHAMHRKSNFEYVDYFAQAHSWQGNPEIKEPNKADDLKWFDINNLPENTLSYIKKALDNYKNGIMFSEEGFESVNFIEKIA